MMIFEMICENGHVFEGWFEDHGSMKRQLEKGLLKCPVCGSPRVRQSLSTGGMLRDRGGLDSHAAARKGAEAFLRALHAEIQANFEDVGAEFAKTALKIHYGVEPGRNIRGTTTQEEEKMLKDEGVEFYKIPVPQPPEEAELN